MNQSQQDIIRTCDKVKRLLLEKNKKYGDAALNPTRILSKSNSVEQILIRIDDKLNRIQKGVGLLGTDEDVVQDLAGYFILLMIALDRQKQEQRRNPRSIDDAWDTPQTNNWTEQELRELRELGEPNPLTETSN